MTRSSRASIALTLWALGSAAAGCGSSSRSVDLRAFLDRVATASCTYHVACGEIPDMATCLAIARWPGYQATLERDISFGRVMYDAVKAAACLDRLESTYGIACTRSAQASAGDTLDTVCTGMFTGTVAPGGACFLSEECAGGALCQPNDVSCTDFMQCCPGVCVTNPPPAPPGGDCSAGQRCADGNICAAAEIGGPLICMAPLA
ncbi:MAG TPA: hypothetical protein VIF57_02085, partial [Polyangia bacterium]